MTNLHYGSYLGGGSGSGSGGGHYGGGGSGSGGGGGHHGDGYGYKSVENDDGNSGDWDDDAS